VFDGDRVNTTQVVVALDKQNLYPPIFTEVVLEGVAMEELDDSITQNNPHWLGTVSSVHRLEQISQLITILHALMFITCMFHRWFL